MHNLLEITQLVNGGGQIRIPVSVTPQSVSITPSPHCLQGLRGVLMRPEGPASQLAVFDLLSNPWSGEDCYSSCLNTEDGEVRGLRVVPGWPK